MNLIALLLPYITALGGTMRTAPFDVFLREDAIVQPDLLAILPSGGAALSARGLEGAPDLVIEVLSPSNRDHDALTKRALYGIAGVREYWIVDPEARTVEVTELHRDALHSRGVVAGGSAIPSALLPDVAFTADEVFAGLDEIAPPPQQA